MNINFDQMSLKELRDLQSKIERAITSYETRKRRDALAAIEEAARQHGFNLAELTGVKPVRAGAVAPKYANPEDSTMTWTGRGRKPNWVKEALDQGKSLDDLLI